jgi:DNA-binding PadR family transcriptional regulator
MAAKPRPKMTLQTQMVLLVLLAAPDRERYGLELSQLTGIASGTIYPILQRLEEAGWLRCRWEEVNSEKEGRPARRFWRLRPGELATVRDALARATSPVCELPQFRLHHAGGEG